MSKQMTDKKPTAMEMITTAASLLKALKVALENNAGEMTKEELNAIYNTDLESLARSIRMNAIRQLTKRNARLNYDQTK